MIARGEPQRRRMRGSGAPVEPANRLGHIGGARPFGRTPPIWIAATRLDVLGLVGEDQVLHVADGNHLPVGEVDDRIATCGVE